MPRACNRFSYFIIWYILKPSFFIKKRALLKRKEKGRDTMKLQCSSYWNTSLCDNDKEPEDKAIKGFVYFFCI
jgi:hypothetical protein